MPVREFKKCYFVIYDQEENLVAYLDSYIEISSFTKLRLVDISKRYNNNGYKFVLDNKFYTLYAFKNID